MVSGITYEMLFDLLRRERNRDDLQKLDETFYADVLAYMAQKKSGSSSDMSAESEKARIQFHNIKKILKELYDRREKKIVILALNAVRTGALLADASSFLPEEQLLFNELKTQFSKYRGEILDNVLRGSVPFAGNVPSTLKVNESVSKERDVDDSASTSQDSAVSQPDYAPEVDMASSELDPKAELKPDAPTESQNDKKQDSASIQISFIKAVPRFAGADEQVFGPFSPGDTASLPDKIASVLIRKGRAEEI